jgi:hypothetical protein
MRRQARRPSRPLKTGVARGLLAAHAVTTIYYLIRREMAPTRAKRIISAILRVFGIATVDAAVIREALELPCADFEDAVTAAAAHLARCDYIVTTDVKGFNGSLVSSFTPEGILPLLVADAGH